MNRADVRTWLDRYVEAWRSRDPEQVGALFGDEAVYRYRPYPSGRTLVGHAAIVEGWLAHTDGPDDWDASYEVFTVDGDRAVAVGTTRYRHRRLARRPLSQLLPAPVRARRPLRRVDRVLDARTEGG